jgi:predicted  nucleic acid-binding Zn-ribbon protein
MSRAHSLYLLQRIDLSLDQSQKRMDEILAILADDKDVQRATQRLAEIEAVLKEKQQAVRACEHAMETQREKINQTETILYSGSVSNPKELQDLQKEAEALKRYLSVIEDHLLEAMVELEQVEHEHKAAEEALHQLKMRRESEHGELHKEKERLSAEIERMRGDREAALASVGMEDLALYQQLRGRLNGIAVALLENGNCSICGVSIHASLQQTVKSGKELVQCGQCRRILYSG